MELRTPSSARRSRTILVVDDRHRTVSATRTLLEAEGHRVIAAPDGARAFALVERECPQLLIVGDRVLCLHGEDLVHHAREADPLVQIILQTEGGCGPLPRAMLRRLAIRGCHDVTDGPERLLHAVDAALAAHDQLTQLHVAERVKTELLASVSHELRTPLNVIAGYAELLRDGTFGACTPEATLILAKVHANTTHLLQLVEEFLDLSRVEANAPPACPEAVALTPFLRELGESFALLIRTKPVEFVAEVPDGLPAVRAEPAKLRVVVQNLLANAERFTERGRVRLAAGIAPGGRVAIEVSDTGPGIAPEHHETVFDVFRQLQPHDRGGKGVGLGLALARRFARMLGGDISLRSVLGGGSTFIVDLPALGA
jgi:signal transduction histidine kinase